MLSTQKSKKNFIEKLNYMLGLTLAGVVPQAFAAAAGGGVAYGIIRKFNKIVWLIFDAAK